MGLFSIQSMQTLRWTLVGMLACLHLYGIGREHSDLVTNTRALVEISDSSVPGSL